MQNGNNSYYTITQIYKCSSGCMKVKGTLYIYCCNYEDALKKASNLNATQINITIGTIQTDTTDSTYMQIDFSVDIPIDANNSEGKVKEVEVTINDEETKTIIIPESYKK